MNCADLGLKKRGLYYHKEYLHSLNSGRNPNGYFNVKVFRNDQKWVPLEVLIPLKPFFIFKLLLLIAKSQAAVKIK